MYLPNRNKAYIKGGKVENYLLSSEHPIGKHKASFFKAIGFDTKKLDIFKQSLLSFAVNYPVTETEQTSFGVKYIIDGKVQSPNGKDYVLRTIWIIENKDDKAYLITAYPL